MATSKPHIIKTQFVDVEFVNTPDALEFNVRLSEVCRDKLLPAIERLFDTRSSGNQIISIDSLQVDAGILEKEDWENRFVDETINRLAEYLDNLQAGKDSAVQVQSVRGEGAKLLDEDNDSQVILHYLKYGVLPWYSSIHSQSELTSLLKTLVNGGGDFLRELRRLAISNKSAFDRVVMQFEVEGVIKTLIGESDAVEVTELYRGWGAIFEVLHISRQEQRITFFTALRSIVNEGYRNRMTEHVSVGIQNSLGKEKQELLARVAENKERYGLTEREQLILNYALKDKSKKEASEKDYSKKPDDNSEGVTFFEENPVYISNSGLVLLHPFLSRLFENIGYTKKDEWISEELHQRSLVLCHYLVAGVAEYGEFELLLNKIMTGYPVSESLPFEIILSDFEKNEAADLLKSVIKHWSALKNTSVQGLQQTFLQRDGKVVRADTGWLLQVEQKTFDILLDKIPWGFSTIKTPWMDEILSVEWT